MVSKSGKPEWNTTRTKSRTNFLPDLLDDCRSKIWIHTSEDGPGLVTLHRTFTGSVEGTVDDEDSSTHQRGNPIRPGSIRFPRETHICLYRIPCKRYSWDIGRAILHSPRMSKNSFASHYAEGHEISDIADWLSLQSGQDVWHKMIEWQVWHWHDMVKDEVHNKERGLANIYP